MWRLLATILYLGEESSVRWYISGTGGSIGSYQVNMTKLSKQVVIISLKVQQLEL